MADLPLETIPDNISAAGSDKLLTVISTGKARLSTVNMIKDYIQGALSYPAAPKANSTTSGTVKTVTDPTDGDPVVYQRSTIDNNFSNKNINQTISGLHTFTNGLKIGDYRIAIGGTKPAANNTNKFIWVDVARHIIWVSEGSSYFGLQETYLNHNANNQSATQTTAAIGHPWIFPEIGTYIEAYLSTFTTYTAYTAGTAEWRIEVVPEKLDGTSTAFTTPLANPSAETIIRTNVNQGYTDLRRIIVRHTKVGTPGNLTASSGVIIRPYLP